MKQISGGKVCLTEGREREDVLRPESTGCVEKTEQVECGRSA